MNRPVHDLDPPELAGLFIGGAVATRSASSTTTSSSGRAGSSWARSRLALLAIGAGITVTYLNNPFGPGTIVLEGPFAAGFTMVWIIGMINSINFIDGLDGLSTGIAFIAAVTLGLISLTATISQPFVAILCFVLAGSLLGFLRWNFHPATIFIGTSGVMFVGYTLAVLVDPRHREGRRRAARPRRPDHRHLLDHRPPARDRDARRSRRIGATSTTGCWTSGCRTRDTVLVIYGICVLLAGLTFVLSGTQQLYAFMGLALGFGLVLFLATRGDAGDALEAESYEAAHPDDEATPTA